MSVFFTSDLHLGHKLAANIRGFSGIDEHDEVILTNLEENLKKKDKLFILGDVCFSTPQLKELMRRIPCTIVDMVIGNHDMLPCRRYLEAGINNIIGMTKYKKKFWLTHAPIHPQELMGCVNIHGHIHDKGITKPLGSRDYYNVNVEFNNFQPVPFDYIREVIDSVVLKEAVSRTFRRAMNE